MFVQSYKQSERLHNLQAALVQTPTAASCALIKMPWPVCVALRAVSVLHILIMITAEQFLSLASWLSQRLSLPSIFTFQNWTLSKGKDARQMFVSDHLRGAFS